MYTLSKENFTTKTMVKISILGVIGFVLMLLDFPLWFTPPFIKFDLSDIPGLLGAFALGPMAGVVIQFMKNLLKILIAGSNTVFVGELANFLVGSVLVYVAGMVYYREKTFKNAVIGLVLGVLSMTLVMALANYFIMFPFYSKLYGMPLDQIIEISSKVNRLVVDLKSVILFAIVPFNLLKGLVTSLVTILLYKRVSPILHD